MAVYILVNQGGTPLGAPLLGWFAELWGARSTMLVGGAMVLLGELVILLLLRRALEVGLWTEFRPYASRIFHLRRIPEPVIVESSDNDGRDR